MKRKIKLNILDGEVNDILEKLDVDLTTLITNVNFLKKLLILSALKKKEN